jgi:TolB-like protein
VSKRGYRLDTEATPMQGTTRLKPLLPPVTARGALPTLIAILALLIGVIFWAPWRSETASLNEPKTIAVLPLRNTGGDPEQRYLSDGVAVDLIAALSQISDLRVVAQGASFAYSTDDGDVREIAGKLNADVVLEGSIRQVADGLRLTAALVDGATGENLWAKQYDGNRNDLLAFQSGVLEELVRVLSVRLSTAERARLGVRGTTDIDAHDAYLRARELENLYTSETNHEAERLLKYAIRRDPGFALPYAHLSQIYSFRVENGWTEDRGGTIASAFETAERAVELDPDLPFAHFALGRLFTRSYAHSLPNAIERAKNELSTAVTLDENYVDGLVFLANVHIFDGDAETALPLVASAMQRNPVPPYWYALAEGMARYFLGEYEAAEASLVLSRDQNPTAPFPHRFLIATYGKLGRLDDAEWAALEYEALGRNATVDAMVSSASISDPGYLELFAEGLREAGLPEI